MRHLTSAQIGEADTMLEVGSWAWSWMEPPLGTISFFILCLQFAREKRLEIGFQNWPQRVADIEGAKLAAAYPQYDKHIVYSCKPRCRAVERSLPRIHVIH